MVLGWCVILRAPASLKFATGQPSAHIIGRTLPIHVQLSESVTSWLFFITIHYLIFQLSKQVKPSSCISRCQELVHFVLRELLWDFSVLVCT